MQSRILNRLKKSRTRSRRGFTLIEIMAVVVILGTLAAIAIPSFGSLTDEAKQSTFIANLKIYASAANLFVAKNTQYPEDSSSGAIPTGLETYIDVDKWNAGPVIGGVWDFELNSFGITSGFGVHFNGTGETRDDVYMTEIDSKFDGGDLATGAFREIADNSRYYFILAN